MIQGGDPTGTGRGGTSIYGQKLCVMPLLNSLMQSQSSDLLTELLNSQ
jgi:cyclophilin family peptidyl-prolyl cis-trans isomerase